MPSIHRIEKHEVFKSLDNRSDERGEKRDCAVKAVALICGVDYDTAHATLAKHGRIEGRGTHMNITEAACAELGHPLVQVPFLRIIRQYPGQGPNLQNVTSHHMRRYPLVWMNAPDFLMRTRSHILAVMGGKVLDWSVNNALRAHSIYVREADHEAWLNFIGN
jgi:hypothetical protein